MVDARKSSLAKSLDGERVGGASLVSDALTELCVPFIVGRFVGMEDREGGGRERDLSLIHI